MFDSHWIKYFDLNRLYCVIIIKVITRLPSITNNRTGHRPLNETEDLKKRKIIVNISNISQWNANTAYVLYYVLGNIVLVTEINNFNYFPKSSLFILWIWMHMSHCVIKIWYYIMNYTDRIVGESNHKSVFWLWGLVYFLCVGKCYEKSADSSTQTFTTNPYSTCKNANFLTARMKSF